MLTYSVMHKLEQSDHLSKFIELFAADGIVAGFDVSMQNANVMEILKRLQTLLSNRYGGAHRKLLHWRLVSKFLQ